VSHAAGVRAPVTQPESSEAVTWVRSNWVTVVAAILILVQLWLKGVVLSRAFFRIDDYVFIDWSLKNHLTWHFLSTTYDGHLMPGSYALVWVLSRLSLYDWILVSIVDLALLAAACVALLRLLRTLFGGRPAILIPLALYLFSPVMAPGLSFWSTALQWLPTQVAVFMALNAHITYVRTGRYRHAAVAVAWVIAGLAFDELNALVPLLLFALTAGFLTEGGWGRAAIDTLRRFWRAWTAYAVVAIGYGVLYLHQLPTSYQQPGKPGQFSNVLAVLSTMGRVSFIPVSVGGPWRWQSFGDYAVAAEFPMLTQLAWSVVALIVLVSLWYRRHALRAWLILLGWVCLTDLIPVVIGRVGQGIPPQLLGADLHYLADSLPVLAICVGLAFWPVAGEENAYRARPVPRLRQAGTIAALAAYLVGSLWSYQRYEAVTSTKTSRSYIATARAAVAQVPKGSVIVSSEVPQLVFPFGAQTGYMLEPLTAAQPIRRLSWTTGPSGVIPSLLMFDGQGRLRSAFVFGRSLAPPAASHGCWTAGAQGVSIPIGSPLYKWSWELGLTYSGPSATLAVSFGMTPRDIRLLAGTHEAYVTLQGSGGSVRAQVVGGPTVCISRLTIGQLEPSILAKPVPAAPVPG
jgi:hypothetical protein